MSFLLLPIHRPTAVAMFFLGVLLLGGIAWQRMPVELFPALEGSRVYVNFSRPGSEPEVVEREILLPLEARVSALAGINETLGEVRGSGGRYEVLFEPGTPVKVRELEIQRIVAALQRDQPRDTWINVSSSGTQLLSSLAMSIHVLGGESTDRNALHDMTQELIAPRFAAISGVSQALVSGGAGRQVTIAVDSDRAAAAGVTNEAVTAAVRRNAGRLQFVGGVETEAGRINVMLDGRPRDIRALGEIRVQRDRPARLRHVSDVDFGTAREESMFRVNGQAAVGLVLFQEDGANLVRLGRTLRERVGTVSNELSAQGIQLIIGQDASEQVEEQIGRLGRLGASGFVIALVVLFFFLKQWRAVAVVGLAVPVSLFAALALLFISGQSLNLVSLFGLALAIGLVVDNSVVVFEAITRQLERGAPIEDAVATGLRRTVRAIVAASATTAVVFLPLQLVDFEDQMVTQLVRVVTLAILIPLGASLLVAVGLVPLLAHRLAAPAARRRLADNRARRQARGGLIPPDQLRILFTGVVKRALRHPPAWITGTLAAVLVTLVIALNWVSSNSSSNDPDNVDQLQFATRFATTSGSLAKSSHAMLRLERVALDLPSVESVETRIDEDGGSLTVHLIDRDDRPADFRAQDIRNAVNKAGKKIGGLQILRPGEEERGTGKAGGGGQMFGGGADEIVMSGPDSATLERLAASVRAQLESMPQVSKAWSSARPGLEEFWVEPVHRAFESLGLAFDQVLPSLRIAGREGERLQTGFVQANGRELPLVVERLGARSDSAATMELQSMRMQTEAGVVPVAMLASMRQMPPPPTIVHHNGRRELSVFYRMEWGIPQSGPTRLAIDDQIREAVRAVPRPPGYTIETKARDESSTQFRQVIIPVILLLFLVLAMTFESLALPLLVLVALPLTLLGATWALAFAGLPFDMMAMLGAVALIGLTVNPAILLVDRMQQLVRGAHWSAGAAALAAVRERTRPVMMTTATTLAGLWPLAIATGRENEIWPPFATIVMGGLVTSSILTLFMMPVGFILLRKLDVIFMRVGPWLGLAWFGSTAAIMAGLIVSGTIQSLGWQVTLTALTGGLLLAAVVLVFRPREMPAPDVSSGPPRLEVSHLHKIYGEPSPIQSALLAQGRYARKVVAAGATAFGPADARERLIPLFLATAGIGYLAYMVSSGFWTLVFLLIATLLTVRFGLEVRKLRGYATALGQVQPGGPENIFAFVAPWLSLALFAWITTVAPAIGGDGVNGGQAVFLTLAAVVVLAIQMLRDSARRQADGRLSARAMRGSLRPVRNVWRSFAARWFGLDLPVSPVAALNGLSFTVTRGMVGILGPNGAGKTTLIRQLAGVLNPSRGVIKYGGVRLPLIQRFLARWVGYLPQDAGIPGNMTARQYLTWFAALYDIRPAERAERVSSLLNDVGLSDKMDATIGSLSGGMRQRVAVARTLLRLPPVIIVDEPTVGLDPRERIRFRNLLSRLARDRIVLFSTHVVEDVAVACDRVLVIARGELRFDGDTGDLANEAAGCVWELRAPAHVEPELPTGSIHLEEKPAADGSIVHRILSAGAPTGATATDPTLEDGYMWLLARTGEDVNAAQDAQEPA